MGFWTHPGGTAAGTTLTPCRPARRLLSGESGSVDNGNQRKAPPPPSDTRAPRDLVIGSRVTDRMNRLRMLGIGRVGLTPAALAAELGLFAVVLFATGWGATKPRGAQSKRLRRASSAPCSRSATGEARREGPRQVNTCGIASPPRRSCSRRSTDFASTRASPLPAKRLTALFVGADFDQRVRRAVPTVLCMDSSVATPPNRDPTRRRVDAPSSPFIPLAVDLIVLQRGFPYAQCPAANWITRAPRRGGGPFAPDAAIARVDRPWTSEMHRPPSAGYRRPRQRLREVSSATA